MCGVNIDVKYKCLVEMYVRLLDSIESPTTTLSYVYKAHFTINIYGADTYVKDK